MPTQVETTDYLGGFQYKNEDLQYFPTAEGYVNVTDRTFFNYVYNYTDHLGNIRLSYTQSGTELKILEENHYYPFGLKHNNYNTDKVQFKKSELGTSAVLQFAVRNNNQYKYNGKEFQDELGLNMYDYHARNYDPAIGRWMNIDPLAEKSRRWSPYTYAVNNPVYFIDPDGMEIVNGETATRERLQNTNNLQKENIDNKYGGKTDLKKSDFASKQEYKDYKTSVNNFEKSSKALEKSIATETKIQNSINNFADVDPKNFDIANNLSVDIVVNAGSTSKISGTPMSNFGGAVTETGVF